MMDHPAVIILAAGHSERMGQPKHLLSFSEEENFLEHIIRVYQRFKVDKLVLVVNPTMAKESLLQQGLVKIVMNPSPEIGRFHSIQLGLKQLDNSPVFIQNIDNPFVNAGLLIKLMEGLGEGDYAVPVYDGKGGHPILLSGKIIKPVIQNFPPESHFNEVLKSYNRQDVIVSDPYIKVNINTPGDYQKYFLGVDE